MDADIHHAASNQQARQRMKLGRAYLMAIAAVAGAAMVGCNATGPKLFPRSPVETKALPDGGLDRSYDVDRDGRVDYCERLAPDGRIVRLAYISADGAHTEYIDLEQIPVERQRHLLLLVDSISFPIAQEAWQKGMFRYCSPPSRTISPFPVMSDLSFSEFFGCSPSPGVESCFFDGKRLTNGYDTYAADGNVHWARFVDYRMSPIAHMPTYLDPYPWLSYELREVQEVYHQHRTPMTVAYCVGTSAAGARHGRRGHQRTMARVDRCCHWLFWRTKGRARFTIMSDHGHFYGLSKRLSLAHKLARMGYRVGDTLAEPDSIVVPEFGMVGCAAVYTKKPETLAHDILKISGVELSAYRDALDRIVVQSRSGRAEISHATAGYRYRCDSGDPLGLLPIVDRLTQEGRVSPDGFIDDRVLFEATTDSDYPDAVYRLWRAFHGLVEHTPDVLVSLSDGYYSGSKMMSSLVGMFGVHGNLRKGCSNAFVMTSAGQLPPVLRIKDLRASLQQLGVSISTQPFKVTYALRICVRGRMAHKSCADSAWDAAAGTSSICAW